MKHKSGQYSKTLMFDGFYAHTGLQSKDGQLVCLLVSLSARCLLQIGALTCTLWQLPTAFLDPIAPSNSTTWFKIENKILRHTQETDKGEEEYILTTMIRQSLSCKVWYLSTSTDDVSRRCCMYVTRTIFNLLQSSELVASDGVCYVCELEYSIPLVRCSWERRRRDSDEPRQSNKIGSDKTR
jgi:hypothetical protein